MPNAKQEPISTNTPLPVLKWKHIAGIWLACVLAVIAVMVFMISVEREVSQYSRLTFEQSARAALKAGEYSRAARICNGALRTGLGRSDYLGLALLLRAEALTGEEQSIPALDSLLSASRMWSKYYYYASAEQRQEAMEFGVGLGLRFLQVGDVNRARQAVSAAGICSGKPAGFLYEEGSRLERVVTRVLWPEGPCIALVEFKDLEGPRYAPWTRNIAEDLRGPSFTPWAEEQGRTLLITGIDATGGRNGGPCSTFEVSDSTKSGRSYYGIPVYIPLSERPFGIRVRFREKAPCAARVAIDYWFELARKAAVTYSEEKDAKDVGDGWRQFDILRDFYAERKASAEKDGYDATGGVILRIGITLEPGPANQIWVDKIELFVPDAH